MIYVLMLRFLAWLVCRMPRKPALALGKFLGGIFYYLQSKRHKICLKNMDILLGSEVSPERKRELTHKMYGHMGKNIVEFFRMPLYVKEFPGPLFTVEGIEHWEAAVKKNKSVFVLTAHLGLWEFAAVGFSILGAKSSFITKSLRNASLNEFWMNHRKIGNVHPIDKKNSSKAILQCIKSHEPLGFILDQNMNLDNGVYVDFGTRKACTLNAPAILARRYDVTVIGAFVIRGEDDRYRFIITPEIPLLKTEDAEGDITANTQNYSNLIRDFIIRYPDQWIWMHRRFKNQPDGSKIYSDEKAAKRL